MALMIKCFSLICRSNSALFSAWATECVNESIMIVYSAASDGARCSPILLNSVSSGRKLSSCSSWLVAATI